MPSVYIPSVHESLDLLRESIARSNAALDRSFKAIEQMREAIVSARLRGGDDA